MFSSKPKFDATKCKVQLKTLVIRLNQLSQKKGNLAKSEKTKVGQLLREEKGHNARILVESIIREDYLLESYELIKQYAEMLLSRLNVLVAEPELKPEVSDAVCAIVYTGWLMGSEIKELKELFNLFTAKYGKEFTKEVLDNKGQYINERLLKIASNTQVPDQSLVEAYLVEIAREYGIEYTPKPPGHVSTPLSATVGIELPTPGMPMPGAAVPDGNLIELGDPVQAGGGGAGPSGASSPVALPLAQGTVVPAATAATATAVPLAPGAVPVFVPTPAPGAPAPYSVALGKAAAAHAAENFAGAMSSGFGFVVNAENVVVAIDGGGTNVAAVNPGDRLLAVNGTNVTADVPIKSLAADVDMGAQATFTFLRAPGAAPPPAGGGSGGGGGGGSIYPDAGLPVAAAFAVPVEQQQPTVIGGGPPAQPAPQPPSPAAPPAAPAVDVDDALARRLEALRG